jgi:tRNA(His) 5'-end guanylyltransferase
MPVNDQLGKRMKEFYEQVPKYRLMRRTPVIIRIDGKAFHTFTRGFERPFDNVLGTAMCKTMQYLCENIQGCIFGYTQSDEITLVLSDYIKLSSDAWFGYEVQKMCSISASMATMAFNRFFKEEVDNFLRVNSIPAGVDGFPNALRFPKDEHLHRHTAYLLALHKGAMFDARVFNIPKEEVVNCVYWRQVDAARNSVQMVGQANFSHNELQNKTCNMIQDMLWEQRGINWNDYPTRWKRGACWTREKGIDYDMPMLKGEGRKYLEDLVHYVEEERV